MLYLMGESQKLKISKSSSENYLHQIITLIALILGSP